MAALTLVERVARVLHVSIDDGYTWEVLRPDEHARWMSLALAVMEEMVEPPASIVQAGALVDEHPVGDFNSSNIWRAMIEAAIAEASASTPREDRSTENLIRNIIRGMDEKGAIGVSLDRAALEGMLDLSTAVINVEFIGGKNV